MQEFIFKEGFTEEDKNYLQDFVVSNDIKEDSFFKMDNIKVLLQVEENTYTFSIIKTVI